MVCGACYFQLRQLQAVLQSLTSEAATSLVHAIISCRLDYCNALLMALQIISFSDCSLCRALLRSWSLACGERSTSLRSLSLYTGYRFGNGWLTRPRWQLWCTNALMAALRSTWQSSVIQLQALTDVQEWDQLTVGGSTYCTQTSFGDRSFAVDGPRHAPWNNLPDATRDSSLSFLTFTKLLKPYLFAWLPRRIWFLTCALQMY